MTTIIQKLLNIATVSAASLEWGSHRVEFGLRDHIFCEDPISSPESTEIVDPITGRSHEITLPGPVIYGLENVSFHPSLGILKFGGIPIKESLPYYYSGPFLKGRDFSGYARDYAAEATAFTIQTNFYHFLLEDLPRLLLLSREKGVTRLYSGAVRVPNFAKEILDILEIELVRTQRPMAFKRLWFVGRLGAGLAPSRLAAELLRGAFGTSGKRERSERKVYISRRNSQREYFDEAELQASLESVGFETFSFESMKFSEQVELAESASLIVGPHGAGLANQVFMREGSSLLEILSDEYATPLFEVIAGERLKYGRVVVRRDSLDSRQLIEDVFREVARLSK